MTPDEHYREAERLLKQARGEEYNHKWTSLVALAQVHATLATIYRSTERLVEK